MKLNIHAVIAAPKILILEIIIFWGIFLLIKVSQKMKRTIIL